MRGIGLAPGNTRASIQLAGAPGYAGETGANGTPNRAILPWAVVDLSTVGTSPAQTTTTADVAAGVTTLTLPAAAVAGIFPGVSITGPGIPAGTKVTSVNYAGIITISAAPTATTAGASLTLGSGVAFASTSSGGRLSTQ